MGTSVSQASPRNTNWSPVFACYEFESIPMDRVINEVWRAADNSSSPISEILSDDAIYKCFEAVRTCDTQAGALTKYTDYIMRSKNNSFVAELAKRSIPLAFQHQRPADAWCSHLFAGITDYFVSRDLSGFVGNKYRNKSVIDLIKFKKILNAKTAGSIASIKISITGKRDWVDFVNRSIERLKIAA